MEICQFCLQNVEMSVNGSIIHHEDELLKPDICFGTGHPSLNSSVNLVPSAINYAQLMMDSRPNVAIELSERIMKLLSITTSQPKKRAIRYTFPRRLVSAQVHDDDRQQVLNYIAELNTKRQQSTLNKLSS